MLCSVSAYEAGPLNKSLGHDIRRYRLDYQMYGHYKGSIIFAKRGHLWQGREAIKKAACRAHVHVDLVPWQQAKSDKGL